MTAYDYLKLHELKAALPGQYNAFGIVTEVKPARKSKGSGKFNPNQNPAIIVTHRFFFKTRC